MSWWLAWAKMHVCAIHSDILFCLSISGIKQIRLAPRMHLRNVEKSMSSYRRLCEPRAQDCSFVQHRYSPEAGDTEIQKKKSPAGKDSCPRQRTSLVYSNRLASVLHGHETITTAGWYFLLFEVLRGQTLFWALVDLRFSKHPYVKSLFPHQTLGNTSSKTQHIIWGTHSPSPFWMPHTLPSVWHL